MEGIVFSVEEFSVFDGPGIRTTVFLKGCPLRCSWCHNPEGQLPRPQVVKSPNGCIGCGSCERFLDENGYTQQSIENCPRHLLRVSGEVYTHEALCKKLLKNAPILCDGGGVTFSGGEPLYQAEFVFACLETLGGALHTAIQTSGFCSDSVFRRATSLADYFLFDLKVMDEEGSVYHTGVSNKPILRNFETLLRSGKEFVVRVPLIPGVVDTPENITAIASFLRERGVKYAELLPYNKMAGGKYKLTGREYAPKFDPSVPCQTRTEIFDAFGITTKIM